MPEMVTIREQDLVDSIADALQYISYFHPMDYIRALGEAYEAEVGPAAILFGAIRDNASTSLDLKRTTAIGALFGGGVAYEISPSFDVRVQYRGFAVKAPDFGLSNLQTNRYEVISMPTVGVAYHF